MGVCATHARACPRWPPSSPRQPSPSQRPLAAPAALRVTAACPTDDVFVRFASSGDVRSIVHRFPGETQRNLGKGDRNVFLVLRLGASWQRVKGGRGTNLKLYAEGPRTERWLWTYRIASPDPEQDASDYVACIRPLHRPGVSFLDRMRRNPGAWTFRVEVTAGVVKGAKARARVVVAGA